MQDELTRFSDRYTKATTLRAEDGSISDHFGLSKLELPNLVPPMRREFVTKLVTLDRGLLDHPSIRQSVEECEHKLRTRRTYKEIEGTEGFAIIEAAGLKPFVPLTEKQLEIVEGRQRQEAQTRHQFSRLAGEASEREWGKST